MERGDADRLSVRPRTRNCWSRHQGRLCGEEVSERRSCRGRLHGRLRRNLPRVQSRTRAVLPDHELHAYINLPRRGGNITLVGAPEKPLAVPAFGLIMRRRSLSGSPIGGIAETQEMLDFCGQHNLNADVEVIPIQKVNEAYERMLKSDVKYRFRIDMGSIKSAKAEEQTFPASPPS